MAQEETKRKQTYHTNKPRTHNNKTIIKQTHNMDTIRTYDKT